MIKLLTLIVIFAGDASIFAATAAASGNKTQAAVQFDDEQLTPITEKQRAAIKEIQEAWLKADAEGQRKFLSGSHESVMPMGAAATVHIPDLLRILPVLGVTPDVLVKHPLLATEDGAIAWLMTLRALAMKDLENLVDSNAEALASSFSAQDIRGMQKNLSVWVSMRSDQLGKLEKIGLTKFDRELIALSPEKVKPGLSKSEGTFSALQQQTAEFMGIVYNYVRFRFESGARFASQLAVDYFKMLRDQGGNCVKGAIGRHFSFMVSPCLADLVDEHDQKIQAQEKRAEQMRAEFTAQKQQQQTAKHEASQHNDMTASAVTASRSTKSDEIVITELSRESLLSRHDHLYFDSVVPQECFDGFFGDFDTAFKQMNIAITEAGTAANDSKAEKNLQYRVNNSLWNDAGIFAKNNGSFSIVDIRLVAKHGIGKSDEAFRHVEVYMKELEKAKKSFGAKNFQQVAADLKAASAALDKAKAIYETYDK